KGTTKMLIDDFLENEGRLGKHALFILDIDNFKNVNDTLGHLTGDKVLVDIAEKIKKSVRMTDICGRIGGDEFVILLKNTPSLAFISAKAKEICTSFKSTLSNQTSTVQISGSIGIAPYNADNLAYTELFVNADTALYNSKKNGKNQFSVFNKDTAVGENNPQIKIR
ncbi:MAG: GGDEF domain-containing protein, partial [Oscillospiraceae bacterium]